MQGMNKTGQRRTNIITSTTIKSLTGTRRIASAILTRITATFTSTQQ